MIKPRRYTTQPLPPYAYLPGAPLDQRFPHPLTHPAGHAYSQTCEVVVVLPPSSWAKQAAYLYGVDLFNAGFYWEAHEAWESIWQKCVDPIQHEFLQALIQLAAAMLKWRINNRRGVRVLIRRVRMKMLKTRESAGSTYMGLHLDHLLDLLEDFFADFFAEEDLPVVARELLAGLTVRAEVPAFFLELDFASVPPESPST